MKKIIILFSAILTISINVTHAQASDTTITVRKTYHLQQVDGASVDSVVEYSFVKRTPQPQVIVSYTQMPTTEFSPKPINWGNLVAQALKPISQKDVNVKQTTFPRYNNSWGGFDFNDAHPELKRGEVFFMNINVNGAEAKLAYLKEKYQVNARLGKIAYDQNGKKISGQKPVFFLVGPY